MVFFFGLILPLVRSASGPRPLPFLPGGGGGQWHERGLRRTRSRPFGVGGPLRAWAHTLPVGPRQVRGKFAASPRQVGLGPAAKMATLFPGSWRPKSLAAEKWAAGNVWRPETANRDFGPR
eukprot:gene10595-biopygen15349